MPSARRLLTSGSIQKIPSSGIVLLYFEGREGRLIRTIAAFWWGFRMTARCAMYCKMYHFSAQRQSWQGRLLPLSRCIPLGCARLQILRGKIFKQALLWRIIGIEPSCTRERVAVPSPFRGASKLPPNPPWSMGDFALPLNPHRPKSFQCPLETLTNRAPIGCRQRTAGHLRLSHAYSC